MAFAGARNFWLLASAYWPMASQCTSTFLTGVFMLRKKMNVMVIRQDGMDWWKLHFCSLIQRAGYSESFDDAQDGKLKDVADLWFPIPAKEESLFSVIECVLQTHNIAHHLVDLSEIQVIQNKGSSCTDYEIRYQGLEG